MCGGASVRISCKHSHQNARVRSAPCESSHGSVLNGTVRALPRVEMLAKKSARSARLRSPERCCATARSSRARTRGVRNATARTRRGPCTPALPTPRGRSPPPRTPGAPQCNRSHPPRSLHSGPPHSAGPQSAAPALRASGVRPLAPPGILALRPSPLRGAGSPPPPHSGGSGVHGPRIPGVPHCEASHPPPRRANICTPVGLPADPRRASSCIPQGPTATTCTVRAFALPLVCLQILAVLAFAIRFT